MAENFIQEIQKRTLSDKPPIRGSRSQKWDKISFEDLVFVPAQLSRRPVDYYREKIEAKTIIGKLSKYPLNLETPILIAALSFGAISKNAKLALAKASKISGTCTNTGEGGMLSAERKFAKILIFQYSSGRFGATKEVLKKADAIKDDA